MKWKRKEMINSEITLDENFFLLKNIKEKVYHLPPRILLLRKKGGKKSESDKLSSSLSPFSEGTRSFIALTRITIYFPPNILSDVVWKFSTFLSFGETFKGKKVFYVNDIGEGKKRRVEVEHKLISHVRFSAIFKCGWEKEIVWP